MKNTSPRQQPLAGFTIVELMLATSVFSIVLLVALGSFLQIGRVFYKGVSLTAVQNIATQVLNDISNNMQTSSSFSLPTPGNGYTYWCIGNTRYTYITHSVGGQQVAVPANLANVNYNNGAGGGSFGLLKDTLAGNSGCATPCFGGTCLARYVALSSNSVEMLGDNMRLASISITQPSASTAPNLYNVNMVVVYGDDSVLDFSNPANPTCVAGSQNQAFCSVVTISTAVLRGAQT